MVSQVKKMNLNLKNLGAYGRAEFVPSEGVTYTV